MMDDYPGGWFGPSWGAPVCEEDRHLDTPTDERCIDCLERFVEGDQGLSIPFTYEIGNMTLTHQHLACFRRGLPRVRPNLCAGCRDIDNCSPKACKLGRTRRRPAPPPLVEEHDFETVAGLVAELRAHAARIAHFASMAMTETVHTSRDEGLIRDMHDIIGDVGALQSVANLLEDRHVEQSRRWPRLLPPSPHVQAVELPGGEVARRQDPEGYYWDLRGWAGGVDWAQLLRWGPLVDVTEREQKRVTGQ